MVIKYLPMYTHYNNYIDLIIWWLIMYWFFVNMEKCTFYWGPCSENVNKLNHSSMGILQYIQYWILVNLLNATTMCLSVLLMFLDIYNPFWILYYFALWGAILLITAYQHNGCLTSDRWKIKMKWCNLHRKLFV